MGPASLIHGYVRRIDLQTARTSRTAILAETLQYCTLRVLARAVQ